MIQTLTTTIHRIYSNGREIGSFHHDPERGVWVIRDEVHGHVGVVEEFIELLLPLNSVDAIAAIPIHLVYLGIWWGGADGTHYLINTKRLTAAMTPHILKRYASNGTIQES